MRQGVNEGKKPLSSFNHGIVSEDDGWEPTKKKIGHILGINNYYMSDAKYMYEANLSRNEKQA